MDSSQYSALSYTPCENGIAAAIPGDARNTFRCRNVSSTSIQQILLVKSLLLFRSICIISSATLSSAVLEVGPHLGVGHQTQAENLLPSRRKTALLSSKSPPLERCYTSAVFLSIPSRSSGERSAHIRISWSSGAKRSDMVFRSSI